MTTAVQPEFTFEAVVTPRGDGTFVLTPGKPFATATEVTPRQAARYLGCSRAGVYRLLDIGRLECRRPTPGKILIPLAALKKHKTDSADPEFWAGVPTP